MQLRFRRASLHTRAVPWQLPWLAGRGQLARCCSAGVCTPRALTQLGVLLNPCSAWETSSEIAPEPSPGKALWLLLLWRQNVRSSFAECQIVIRGALVVKFSPKEYGAGGGNCKMILILLYTESLALLTVAYCFLPQSSAQSLSGRGYSVSYFTAIFFTSVDVDCRGLQHLLHIH